MFIVVFLKTTHLFDEDSGAFPLRSITNEASGDLFIRGESFFNINLMSGIAIYFFCVIPVVESLGYLVSLGFNTTLFSKVIKHFTFPQLYIRIILILADLGCQFDWIQNQLKHKVLGVCGRNSLLQSV